MRQAINQALIVGLILGATLFSIDKAIALSSEPSSTTQNTATTSNPSAAPTNPIDDTDVLVAKEPIIFGPKTDPKGVITVFTDMDCVYCRKLHIEINQLSNLGIQVRYLAFPRQGIGSSSYNKLVSVWCSDKPEQALTQAMQGETITSKTCTNPVKEHVLLGRKIGIMGTPTIIFADGAMWPGYAKADRIAREAIMQNKSNGNGTTENGKTGNRATENRKTGNETKENVKTGSAKSQ